jgi:hypothetical protein
VLDICCMSVFSIIGAVVGTAFVVRRRKNKLNERMGLRLVKGQNRPPPQFPPELMA